MPSVFQATTDTATRQVDTIQVTELAGTTPNRTQHLLAQNLYHLPPAYTSKLPTYRAVTLPNVTQVKSEPTKDLPTFRHRSSNDIRREPFGRADLRSTSQRSTCIRGSTHTRRVYTTESPSHEMTKDREGVSSTQSLISCPQCDASHSPIQHTTHCNI